MKIHEYQGKLLMERYNIPTTKGRVADNPEAMIREAQRLQGQNQVPEAIVAYQRALLQLPDHANSWFNLGLLFRMSRQFDDALACYQRALNLGIASPEEAHHRLPAKCKELYRR